MINYNQPYDTMADGNVIIAAQMVRTPSGFFMPIFDMVDLDTPTSEMLDSQPQVEDDPP